MPIIVASLANSPIIPYCVKRLVVALRILGTTAAIAILAADGKMSNTLNACNL
jgi:hypothetical protein